jgi:hypothetical protein
MTLPKFNETGHQGPESQRIWLVDVRAEARTLEFLHNQGEAVDVSTREAPLDAVFWLCIRARL